MIKQIRYLATNCVTRKKLKERNTRKLSYKLKTVFLTFFGELVVLLFTVF